MRKLYLILLLISILVATTIFLPAANQTIDEETFNFYGYQLTFGKNSLDEASGYIYDDEYVATSIKFSFVAMIAYFFPLIILIILFIFDKWNKNMLTFVSLSFLVSTILLFLITSITNLKLEITLYNAYDMEVIKLSSLGFKPCYGVIIGALLSLGGCLFAGFKGLEKENKV